MQTQVSLKELPACEVASVQFSLMAAEEIFRISCVEVTEEEFYIDNQPKPGGLFDLRMGTIEKKLRCQTCMGDQSICLGHVGRICLMKPCWHVGFLPRAVEIFKCVCFTCGALLVNPEDERIKTNLAKHKDNAASRLRVLVKLCSRVKRCSATSHGVGATTAPILAKQDATKEDIFLGQVVERKLMGCGSPVHQYRIINPITVTHEIPKENRSARENTKETFKAEILTAEKALEILASIDDRHFELLGFTDKLQPKDLILQYLIVCPPCIRPSTKGNGNREDDLTIILQKIVKSNNRLKKQDLTQDVIQNSWTILQQNITEFYDRDKTPVKQKQNLASVTSADKTKSCITRRLIGKEGLVRWNLVAKRINKTARSVISPDVFIDIEEVAIPAEIARTLTMGETVNRFNIDQLQRMVTRGPSEDGGAKFIIRNEQQIDLRTFEKAQGTEIERKRKEGSLRDYNLHVDDPLLEEKWREICTLREGDEVARQLVDGDPIVLNRQPSLHRSSMMCHDVRILPGKTIRPELTVTTPYNADFDGDEMNIHVPANQESAIEMKTIMGVAKHIVSPNKNNVVIGLKQDAVLAMSTLTERDTFLDRASFMQLVCFIQDKMPKPSSHDRISGKKYMDGTTTIGTECINLITSFSPEATLRLPRAANGDLMLPTPAILKPKPLWSGKQLLSLILTKDMCYTGATNFHPPSEDELPLWATDRPERSLDEVAARWPSGTPDWVVKMDTTNAKAALVMSPTDTRVIIRGGDILSGKLCKKTMGVGGALIHMTYVDQSPERAAQLLNDAIRIAHAYHMDTTASIGVSDMEPKANCAEIMKGLLKIADATTAKWMKMGLPKQDLEMLINKMLNDLRDRFASKTMSEMDRNNTFNRIIKSGAKGTSLNPAQVRKAVGQQNIEGSRVSYQFKGRALPHCVRDAPSSMENGMVANNYFSGLHPQEMFIHTIAGRAGLIDTAVKTSYAGYLQRKMCKAAEDTIVKYDGTVRDSYGNIVQFVYGEDNLDATYVENCTIDSFQLKDDEWTKQHLWNSKDLSEATFTAADRKALEFESNRLLKDRKLSKEAAFESNVLLAVNIKRLLDRMASAVPSSSSSATFPAGVTALQLVKDLILLQSDGKGSGMWDLLPIGMHNRWETLFALHLRSSLCSKKLIQRHNITCEQWTWLKKEIRSRWRRSQVNPGEAVGVIASQSISEPATQMTLNTFHNSGNSAMDVTLGIPRFNELINANKNIKTPCMTLYLKKPLGFQKELVKKIAAGIVEVLVSDLISFKQVLHEPLYGTEDGSMGPITYPEDEEIISMFALLPPHSIHSTVKNPVWSDCIIRILFDRTKMDQEAICMQQIVDSVRATFSSSVLLQWSHESAPNGPVLRIRPMGATHKNQHSVTDEDLLVCQELMDNYVGYLQVKGISTVKRTFITEEKGGEWRIEVGTTLQSEKCLTLFLETQGSNLLGAFGVGEIDWTRSTTNNIHQIKDVFGIEAARATIIKEIKAVMKAYGVYANSRHLSLIADIQTHRGEIMPINRHGINRIEATGPMIKASFEETVPTFLDAARFGTLDKLLGITPALMLGKTPCVGTGTFGLFLNTEALKEPWVDHQADAEEEFKRRRMEARRCAERESRRQLLQEYLPRRTVQSITVS